jgi:hypothetical protein
VLRVVAGDATPEELAAVVAAVAAATSHATSTAATSLGTAQPAGTSLWSAPGFAHRNIRATFTPGPDSWRTSLWPR